MPKGSFSPTIPQLRALEAVAATGSFEGASTTVTRQSVFQSVKALEGHINRLETPGEADPISLTVAGTGQLTAEGRALISPAMEFLTAFVAFKSTCTRVRSGTASLVAGCFPAHADRLAVAALPLIDDGMTVQIEVTEGSRARRGSDMVTAVARHELDVAIVPEGPLPNGLQADRLYGWQLRCVVAEKHRLAGDEACDVSQLQPDRVLASPSGHVTRGIIESTGAVKVAFENSSVDALVALGRTGWGVALVADDCAPLRNCDAGVRATWPTLHHRNQPLGGWVNVVTRADTSREGQLGELVTNLLATCAEGRVTDAEPHSDDVSEAGR